MRAIIAALIVTLLTGAGSVLAAQGALPSDALYGVKQTVEQVSPGPKVQEKKAKPNQAQTADEDDEDAGDTDDSDGAPIKVKISDGKASPHTSVISGTVGITLTKTFSDVVEAGEVMPGHSENGLGAKLLAAEKSLVKGHEGAAQHQVGALIRQANAACRSGNLDDASYNTLYADYAQLIVGMGGEAQPAVAPCATKAAVEDETDSAPATEQAEGQGSGQGQGLTKENRGKSASAPGRARR